MRTTMTLDPDVYSLLQKVMQERGLSLKQAVNDLLRSALGSERPTAPFRTPTFHMGFDPTIPMDKALRLAGELEDEELVRKLAVRK
jgi:hypothetical protein